MKPDLDQISAEITQLMIEATKDEQALQPLVLKIWAAFDEAKEKRVPISVEGATNKTAWTKLRGKPKMRYCQYLVRDGSRKRGANADTHSVRVTVNLDRATHAILDGVGREITDKKLNGNTLTITFVATATAKTQPKKKEEKKPLKHAKHPSAYNLTWCSVTVTNSNTARTKNHATCPYCLAAMAAGTLVQNPKNKRDSIGKELKDWRERLERHEATIAKANTDTPAYRYAVDSVEEERATVAKLQAELDAVKAITTPEQAVEAAKARIAEREARRVEYEKHPVHIQSPVAGKNRVEMTLCGEVIDIGTDAYEGTRMAYGAHAVATCGKCIELSKQVGLGVTEPQQPIPSTGVLQDCPTEPETEEVA